MVSALLFFVRGRRLRRTEPSAAVRLVPDRQAASQATPRRKARRLIGTEGFVAHHPAAGLRQATRPSGKRPGLYIAPSWRADGDC